MVLQASTTERRKVELEAAMSLMGTSLAVTGRPSRVWVGGRVRVVVVGVEEGEGELRELREDEV